MSGEEIVEEEGPNVLIESLSKLEARTLLMVIYWIIVAIALGRGLISESSFRELMLASPIITYLLKKI